MRTHITSRQAARRDGSLYALKECSLRRVSLGTIKAMRPTLLRWNVSNAKRARVPERWQEVWARAALRACLADARKHQECYGASVPPAVGSVCYDFLFEGKGPECEATV